VLSEGDVLLSVGGERIGDDGTYASGTSRLPLSHLFDMKTIGQSVPMEVWRNDHVATVQWKASRYPFLDRFRGSDTPRYFFYAGLLFVPITGEYIAAANPGPERRAAIFRALRDQVYGGQDPERELIVLAKVFRDPVNQGAPDATPVIVERVNGQPVHDLADLASIVDGSQQKQDVFQLAFPSPNLIAIDHAKASAGHDALLAAQGMSHDRKL